MMCAQGLKCVLIPTSNEMNMFKNKKQQNQHPSNMSFSRPTQVQMSWIIQPRLEPTFRIRNFYLFFQKVVSY